MRNGLTGQHAALSAAARAGMAALGLVLALGLGACTTMEGTNAMTDIGTFEREVLNPTAAGIGLIPGAAEKDDLTTARAPLVLPRSADALPAPTQQVAAAQLPANSDTVRIDTSNLTEADIQRLRNAKVVDLRTLAGRPLTPEEARTLTARMQQANMQVTANQQRPLYLPPDEYFTRVGDAEMVCAIGNGEVVSLRDPRCPAEVRRALQQSGPSSRTLSSDPQGRLLGSEIGQ